MIDIYLLYLYQDILVKIHRMNARKNEKKIEDDYTDNQDTTFYPRQCI